MRITALFLCDHCEESPEGIMSYERTRFEIPVDLVPCFLAEFSLGIHVEFDPGEWRPPMALGIQFRNAEDQLLLTQMAPLMPEPKWIEGRGFLQFGLSLRDVQVRSHGLHTVAALFTPGASPAAVTQFVVMRQKNQGSH